MLPEMECDVSVVIVNYNQAKLTQACIQTVIAHSTGLSVQLIVVDNSDIEPIDDHVNGFSDLILIKNPQNLGFAAANNLGLAVARGRYVLFLNNDTLFIENTLSSVIRFYETLQTKALIGCKLLNEDRSHQYSIVDFNTKWNQFGEYSFLSALFPRSKRLNKFHANATHPNEIRKTDVVKGAFIFGSTNDVKSLNGFDEDYFFYNEEDDLCFRFKESGGDVWYFPQTSIIHLGGATTANMKWFSINHQHQSKLIFLHKHASGIDFAVFLTLHFWGFAIRVPLYLLRGILTLNSFWLHKAFNYGRCLFIYPTLSTFREPVSHE